MARRGSRRGPRRLNRGGAELPWRARQEKAAARRAALGLGSSPGRARVGGRPRQAGPTRRREKKGEEREMADWAGLGLELGRLDWASRGRKRKEGGEREVGPREKEREFGPKEKRFYIF